MKPSSSPRPKQSLDHMSRVVRFLNEAKVVSPKNGNGYTVMLPFGEFSVSPDVESMITIFQLMVKYNLDENGKVFKQMNASRGALDSNDKKVVWETRDYAGSDAVNVMTWICEQKNVDVWSMVESFRANIKGVTS